MLPRTPFYSSIETLVHHGATVPCSGTAFHAEPWYLPQTFCPGEPTTREQMAIFLLRSRMGRYYLPPRPAEGTFSDMRRRGLSLSPWVVPVVAWVEEADRRGVMAACQGNMFCPKAPVSRRTMAQMLLRTLEGPTYVPPVCTVPVFPDVPCSDLEAPWINELVARGFAAGCGGGLYCPEGTVSRGQMAEILTRTFGLDLYRQ